MNPSAAPELPPPPGLSGLGSASLFLDLDGTLASIERRPQDVGPQRWRTELLQRLERRLQGRVAVVSGRTLDEIDRILEGSVTAVAAVHGLVRRCADGRVLRSPPAPALGAVLRRAYELAGGHPGLLVEDKGLSLAIHYRQAPELEAMVAAEASDMARAGGLKLQPGDMVAELCTPGLDKGAALAAFMDEPPFRGSVPVFVGDDQTDEDGFAAADRLGGLGVLVGPGRPTRASRGLAGAPAVRAWLEAAVMEGARP
jgi:trehalose 6-phosphate phosphatase